MKQLHYHERSSRPDDFPGFKKNSVALTKTLSDTEQLVANLNRNLAPLMTNMNGTMTDTRMMMQGFTCDIRPVLISTETALSSKNFTDYLERHLDSIIYGKE